MKYLLAIMALLISANNAFAESKPQNYTLKPGETKTIIVNTDTDKMIGWNFNTESKKKIQAGACDKICGKITDNYLGGHMGSLYGGGMQIKSKNGKTQATLKNVSKQTLDFEVTIKEVK